VTKGRKPLSVLAALRRHEAAGIGLSMITVCELEHGVAKSGSAKN
jgi:predicted nucleic acid-binding protein